jgi:prevent-host-death family protein
MTDITLADAKAHLSELLNRVADGDSVRITRRGKPIAQLSAVLPARKPVDLQALRALTDAMPEQAETAAETVRRMRDGARY